MKRRQDKVTPDGLRSFMAVLGTSDVGIFVCTGGFTKEAWIEARSNENRMVTLMDLSRLFELWVEHWPEISEEGRQLLPLRAVYYLDLDR